jgi:hypothetical protein
MADIIVFYLTPWSQSDDIESVLHANIVYSEVFIYTLCHLKIMCTHCANY